MKTSANGRADVVTLFSWANFREEGLMMLICGVCSRTLTVLGRNALFFFIVGTVASVPILFLNKAAASPLALSLLVLLVMVSSIVGCAPIMHAAFQEMRGRQVHWSESLRFGFERFVPLTGFVLVTGGVGLGLLLAPVGVALVSEPILGGVGCMLLAVGGTGLVLLVLVVASPILLPIWYVALPVCVVEHLGPLASLRRSSQLTKEYRWIILGLALLLVTDGVFLSIVHIILAFEGISVAAICAVILNGLNHAVTATALVVIYHDLRVAKEALPVRQLAA